MTLRWVEELINTRSLEFGTDELTTQEALTDWLRERGLPSAGADLAHVIGLREGLRALLFAGAAPDLAALARETPLVLDFGTAPPRLVPHPESPVGHLLAVIAGAVADGAWERFKVCRNPGCQWAYYDSSRNRSRTWCSMETCGNRAKARTFRSRG